MSYEDSRDNHFLYKGPSQYRFDPRGYKGRSTKFDTRKWEPEQGYGVYLFIKFPGHSAEFAAQTVVLGKRACQPKGKFIGIARKVHDLSMGPRQREALVVYLFESTEAATRFFVSDNRFKQPDFPPPAGACEAWTVVKYLETEHDNHNTFMMCENTLTNATYSEYKYNFAQDFAQLIKDYDGEPFIVQNIGCESLRRHHVDRNSIQTVHIFKDENDVKRMMGDPRYDILKDRQRTMATDFRSVFTIDPEACP